jgi:spore maturation protein SpmA
MSWIYTIILAFSVIFAIFSGSGGQIAAAVPAGAQAGVTLAISMAGSICLWTGAGKLMEKVGLTGYLSRLLRPVLWRLFLITSIQTKSITLLTLSTKSVSQLYRHLQQLTNSILPCN